MKIVGIQKLTLLDYPGYVACTVFLGGCNFRCPYCHNSELLDAADAIMTTDALLEFLRKRQGILDGVCITGGEPTLHPELPELMRSIRALGYRVKLDTNGYRPQVLQAILEEGLADYVAMDVKNGPDGYGAAVGLKGPDLTKIEQSISMLLRSTVDYELRTTLVKPIHTPESMAQMAAWLQHIVPGRTVKQFFLQPFVDRDTVPMSGLSAPNPEELELFRSYLSSCADFIGIRGT